MQTINYEFQNFSKLASWYTARLKLSCNLIWHRNVAQSKWHTHSVTMILSSHGINYVLNKHILRDYDLVWRSLLLKLMHKGVGEQVVAILSLWDIGQVPFNDGNCYHTMPVVKGHRAQHSPPEINELTSGRCGSNLKSINLKLFTQNSRVSTWYEIALWRMLKSRMDEKSTFVQVMAWCHPATSHQ